MRPPATTLSVHSAFTHAEAVAAGVSASSIRQHVRRGQWLAPRRGVYLDARTFGEADAEAQHRLLASAALRGVGDGWASHATAALLHGLPLLGGPPPHVSLTVDRTGPRTPNYRNGLTVFTASLPDHHLESDVHRRTTPARTVVDTARHQGVDAGVVLMDALIRREDGARRAVEDVLLSQERWPGMASACSALSYSSGLSESPLESLSSVRFAQSRLPVLLQQVAIHDAAGFIGRVDFCSPKFGVVGEADGLLKYTSPDDLRAEKIRQERLELAGWIVVRWTWREITRTPDVVIARINAAIARGTANPSPWTSAPLPL